jgi:hypothetical protein
MGFVLQMRHERAGLGKEFRLHDPVKQLQDFLPANSIRQLKMLREIAEGLIEEEISKEQYERNTSLKRPLESARKKPGRFPQQVHEEKIRPPGARGVEWPQAGLTMRSPTPKDAQISGQRVFSSVVELALPGAGVGPVYPGTLLIGELHRSIACKRRRVMGLEILLGIIQPQQASGSALGVSDRCRRNQRDQGC